MLTDLEASKLRIALESDIDASAESLKNQIDLQIAQYAGTSPPPPTVRPTYVGYFGNVAGQAAETADHVNIAFVPSWGYDGSNGPVIDQRTIDWLHEAALVGIQCVVLEPSYVLWSGLGGGNQLLPDAETRIRALFTMLRNAGVLGMIKAIYPHDEPDGVGVSDISMSMCISMLRRVADEFVELRGIEVWCIYSDHGTPGIDLLDRAGQDNYKAGAGELGWYNNLPHGVDALVVPGVASPWRTDPMPFATFALSRPGTAILGFLWLDGGNWEGGIQQGARSNGMAPACRAAFKHAIGRA